MDITDLDIPDHKIQYISTENTAVALNQVFIAASSQNIAIRNCAVSLMGH